jgi:molybdenum cofactor cytidylyltransferase
MGRPKLSLLWRGKTILEHAIAAMTQGGVSVVVVVLGPGETKLRMIAKEAGAEVLELTEPTVEMRDTIQQGLNWIELRYQPNADDGWLLLPADYPKLEKQVVEAILAARQEVPTRSIVVPTFKDRRGHPVWIAWSHVAEIWQLPAGVGLNIYLREHAAEAYLLPVTSPSVITDLDTPEELTALLQEPAELRK